MSAVEVEIKPAPDRLKFGDVDYVRADLYDLMVFQAQTNKETVDALIEVVRRLTGAEHV